LAHELLFAPTRAPVSRSLWSATTLTQIHSDGDYPIRECEVGARGNRRARA
jgi:hypothetical protein